ncbi:hypothetical protein PIB30_062788 [Stylosanthes scabra]|uniref:Uncharacterized protein n=1 Tax=Stylosanthes scabra TaxID=79078 RepID=A0ABU6SLB7_9FABA|nr:hypothetical protein [Stylosanthes scabra]
MARSCLETPKIASHHVYFLSLNCFSQVDAETKGDLSSRSLLSEFKSGHDLEWCWLGQRHLAKEVEVTFKAPWVMFGLGEKPSTKRDLRHQNMSFGRNLGHVTFRT